MSAIEPAPRANVRVGVQATGNRDSPAALLTADPALRVLNSTATPEEIAVVVLVFASLRRVSPTPPPAPSQWASPARRVRGQTLQTHGRGAWRSSGLAS